MASNNDTYKYTPSSAHATRQVLEQSQNINPSHNVTGVPSRSPNDSPFRPQVFRRKSTNYADADAAARAATASESQSSLQQTDGTVDGRPVTENKNATGTGGGSVAWKPTFGRKQSWNQQDLKRSMQMSLVSEGGLDGQGLKGYSETKSP